MIEKYDIILIRVRSFNLNSAIHPPKIDHAGIIYRDPLVFHDLHIDSPGVLLLRSMRYLWNRQGIRRMPYYDRLPGSGLSDFSIDSINHDFLQGRWVHRLAMEGGFMVILGVFLYINRNRLWTHTHDHQQALQLLHCHCRLD